MPGYGGKWAVCVVRAHRQRPIQVVWGWRWRRVSSASYATWAEALAAEPAMVHAELVRVRVMERGKHE